MLDRSTAVSAPYPSRAMLLHTPKAIGITNVRSPNTRPFTLFFRKSSISISSPARNMM